LCWGGGGRGGWGGGGGEGLGGCFVVGGKEGGLGGGGGGGGGGFQILSEDETQSRKSIGKVKPIGWGKTFRQGGEKLKEINDGG